METPNGHERKGTVCIYEFLGQALFMYCVLVGGGSKGDPGIAGPLALFAMIMIFGGVTGGHFNPAVTLGVYIWQGNWAKNLPWMLGIMASQVCGALAGMFLGYIVLRSNVNGEWTVVKDNVPLLLPFGGQDGPDTGEGGFHYNITTFYSQVVCTFIFVLFILNVKGRKTAPTEFGVYGALGVILVLWGLCQVDHFTGASFNPALAVGLTAFQAWWYPENPNGMLTHYLPYYAVGALMGGLLAGLFYLAHEKVVPEPAPPAGGATVEVSVNSSEKGYRK